MPFSLPFSHTAPRLPASIVHVSNLYIVVVHMKDAGRREFRFPVCQSCAIPQSQLWSLCLPACPRGCKTHRQSGPMTDRDQGRTEFPLPHACGQSRRQSFERDTTNRATLVFRLLSIISLFGVFVEYLGRRSTTTTDEYPSEPAELGVDLHSSRQ